MTLSIRAVRRLAPCWGFAWLFLAQSVDAQSGTESSTATQTAPPGDTSTATEPVEPAPASTEPVPVEPETPASSDTGLTPRLPSSPSSGLSPAAWQTQYFAARDLLLAGKFSEARLALEGLKTTAPTSEQARVATEMWAVSRYFEEQGISLISEAELDKSELGAKQSGQRSRDELAMLYINTVVYGVGSGAWLAAQTQTNSATGVVLPMIAFSGLGIGAVMLVDSMDGFRYGVPQSIVTGMYMGVLQGSLWAGYAGANSGIEANHAASIIWGGATAGIVLGAVLGTGLGTTPGRSSWVGSSALWLGSLSGLTALAVEPGSGALVAGAAGHATGAIVGLLTAKELAPSIARVRYLDLGALGGGLLGAGVYAIGLGDRYANGQAVSALIAGGVLTGFGLSFFFTRNMPKDLLPSEEEKTPTGLESARAGISPTPGGASLSFTGVW